MEEKKQIGKTSGWNGQLIALVLLLVVGGFFLWAEHRAHIMGALPYFIMGALPYLILLLCPLMHLFMHRGHGKNGNGHGSHGH
jgi:hypothetical protein